MGEFYDPVPLIVTHTSDCVASVTIHAVDLDRTYIGGIERGERNPGLKTIVRIADALEVDVTELFRI